MFSSGDVSSTFIKVDTGFDTVSGAGFDYQKSAIKSFKLIKKTSSRTMSLRRLHIALKNPKL
jgi:hypothetical protein